MSFHFDCGGINEQGYRKLGGRRSHWQCSTFKRSNKATSKTTASPGPLQPQRSLTLEYGMQSFEKYQTQTPTPQKFGC